MRAVLFSLIALFVAIPASAQQSAPPQPKLLMGLNDCAKTTPADKICRVLDAPQATEILNRLSTKDVAWWRAGDRFTIVARRKAEDVRLCCAFQEKMTRIPGTDFWYFAVRSNLLDAAMFDISVNADGKSVAVIAGSNEWRGPQAPAAPARARMSSLHFETIEIDSPNLGEKRKLLIYLPPGHDPAKRYPVVYVGDGQNVQRRSIILQPLIVAKKLPPIILVGLYNNATPITAGGRTMQRRTADYTLGATPDGTYFLKHEAFLLKEVMPLAEKQFGASSDPNDRLLIGQSASSDWAIDTAMRHPELFARTAGLSPSVPHNQPWGPDKPKLFLTQSQILDFVVGGEVAAQAKAAGEDVVFETHVSGHTNIMWDIQFLDALSWAYGAR
jgi:enterochelin esterase-like enzyme